MYVTPYFIFFSKKTLITFCQEAIIIIFLAVRYLIVHFFSASLFGDLLLFHDAGSSCIEIESKCPLYDGL